MPIPSYIRTKPGRFGIVPAFYSSDNVGTLTANVTTTIRIPTPRRKAKILRCSASAATLPVDNDGTFLATLKKWDDSAGASIAITSAFDLESGLDTAAESRNLTLLTTLTDAQQVVDEGDTLFVEVVNNSAAVDTQPVALAFVVECAVLE